MFMSSIEIIKDFVNDPAVINFKKNDQSRIIDACTIAENKGEIKGEIKGETKERTKMIQAFSKVLSCEKIAKTLNLSEKEVKNYMNTVL